MPNKLPLQSSVNAKEDPQSHSGAAKEGTRSMHAVSFQFQVVSATLGQRSNCTWASIRKYRLTASNFGVVLSAIGRNR